jgi:surfeit locus 1 family protein
LSIGDASEGISVAQYARRPGRAARASRKQAAILGALLLAFLLPAFISLGLWQWRKAESKTALKIELDSRSLDAAIAMPTALADVDSLRHHRVILRGTYDAAHQVLIDNRLHQELAGYHVITPLQLAGSNMHVLVNRGWLAAPANHQQQPVAEVPAGEIELSGIAVLPTQRFFNLAPQPTSGWARSGRTSISNVSGNPRLIRCSRSSCSSTPNRRTATCASGRARTKGPTAIAATPCSGSVLLLPASPSGPIF